MSAFTPSEMLSEKAGFSRRVARRKPPISERNRQARLRFAIEHIGWTVEDWKKILWSDETWVNGDPHTKTYVIRRAGEEWDPTCIVERHRRRKGWMFWGCFHNNVKGPGIFWEKDRGSIKEETYRQHIISPQSPSPDPLVPSSSTVPPVLSRPKRQRVHTDRYEKGVAAGLLRESQHGATGRPNKKRREI